MPGYDPDLDPILEGINARMSTIEAKQANTDNTLTAHAKALDELKAAQDGGDPTPDPDPIPDPEPPIETPPVDIPTPPVEGDSLEVSGPSELAAALKSSEKGLTIWLAPGDYGGFTFSASDKIVRSREPLGAKFGTVRIQGTENFTFLGAEVNGHNSRPLEARNNLGLRLQSVKSQHASDAAFVFINTEDLKLFGCFADHIIADSYKFNAVRGALIQGNWGALHRTPNAGTHADFMQFQIGTSHDVTLRRNVQLSAPGTRTVTQGIFVADQNDGPPTNFLIEENILMCGSPRAISIRGIGITVRNNTCLHGGLGIGWDQSLMYVEGTDVRVENNVQHVGGSGGDDGNTLSVTHKDGAFNVKSVFPNYVEDGTVLADLISEGAAKGRGADTYIRSLAA